MQIFIFLYKADFFLIDRFCVKLATSMLKCAQKINFTHLLELILKKYYSIRYVVIGTNIL